MIQPTASPCARSADLCSGLRAQHEQSYRATTCGEIVNQIAGRNDFTPRSHPDLASQAIDQTNESDINFLNRLGKRYDAMMTVKAGTLLFRPSVTAPPPPASRSRRSPSPVSPATGTGGMLLTAMRTVACERNIRISAQAALGTSSPVPTTAKT